jgi:hypothetical protein
MVRLKKYRSQKEPTQRLSNVYFLSHFRSFTACRELILDKYFEFISVLMF